MDCGSPWKNRMEALGPADRPSAERLDGHEAGDLLLQDALGAGHAAVVDEPRVGFGGRGEAYAQGDQHADGEQAQQRDGDQDFHQGEPGLCAATPVSWLHPGSDATLPASRCSCGRPPG